MKQNNIFFRYFSPVAAQQKLYAAALVALLSSSAYEAEAQVGEPFIHDPSTIALCDGKYYTFGTGEGGIWSEDGWTRFRLHPFQRYNTFHHTGQW